MQYWASIVRYCSVVKNLIDNCGGLLNRQVSFGVGGVVLSSSFENNGDVVMAADIVRDR